MNNQFASNALSVWHSKVFQYIIMTICAIILLRALQRFISKFVDCSKCAVPQTGKKVVQYAAKKIEETLY